MSEEQLTDMSQDDMEKIANATTNQFNKLPLTWEHKERIGLGLKEYWDEKRKKELSEKSK